MIAKMFCLLYSVHKINCALLSIPGLQEALSLERTHALDLSNALDQEKDNKTEKLVAKELKGALDGVQVND